MKKGTNCHCFACLRSSLCGSSQKVSRTCAKCWTTMLNDPLLEELPCFMSSIKKISLEKVFDSSLDESFFGMNF